ncbi:hypothetical protein SELMODRAFT_108899 [Selaginella moellendorffii]|uniref:Protein kinase domain-containing protein n=1 Tax=Selaginella moellendorffii TaxID=88036 RepID=D8S5K8_SELML|nr:serine/threonine-protein kinase STN8, chloroplastic [Selaginella moellendorffii]EFJ20614.1 hypothetical protein SELMODRAFT_108899 [Selaginella moellendorffii]|eukprot:XP_002978628.1 serine/threonine-protein kinase STN8, chloroplastic [Selaginella moellendorffii]
MADRNFSSSALVSTSIGSRSVFLGRAGHGSLGFGFKALGKSFGLGRSSRRNVAICSVGIAEVLTDAIKNVVLEDDSAKQQGLELLDSFSRLPDTSQVGVLGGSLLGWIYLTAKPGVFLGAVDAYFLAPVQAVVDRALGRRGLKRSDFVVGQKLGEGSFGTVYAGAILPKDFQQEQEIGKRSRRLEEYQGYKKFQKVTLKKVKMDVEGALESGEMEEWFNYRMARAAPDVCADFLGSFVADSTRGQFVEGGKWLVWKYEGDSTLADFMKDRRFPENLAEPLLGRSREKDPLKRKALTIRKILREILVALKKMHATGIVHRDVKPANLVVTNKAKLKFIDFGAATDLRVGKNYVPERGMLDPDYCPPELFVMPEETPRPPPAPIAALLSPILWQLNSPDLFDMYSVGIIFLQMASPNLRTPVAVEVMKKELSEVNFDLKAWRKRTRLRPNFELLELGAGRGWELASRLVCERRKRLSAAAALRHPYFLSF